MGRIQGQWPEKFEAEPGSFAQSKRKRVVFVSALPCPPMGLEFVTHGDADF